MLRQIISYSIIGAAAVSTGISLHANDYQVNNLGIVRLARSAVTVFNIGLTYKQQLYYKKWDTNTVEYKIQKGKIHKIAAEKLLDLICINKGVYIKVGQHIGALEYLLPTEYVETMKVLHSNAPQNKVEDLFKVIRQDLKKDPSEIFESFESEPLGTASLAQVHKATLKTGEVVAVKVQHPYVKGNSIVDMKTMEILVNIMAYVFPEFKIQWLVDESKRNLPIELDFVHEGKNAEKVAEMFKQYNWLKVPKVYPNLSTSRVLVMEFLEGAQVTDLDYIKRNNIDRFDIASKLGYLFSHMIFIHGFVHGDPHPGNILVHKNESGSTDIVLLDHGLYANLTEKFRYEYAKFWQSVLNVDEKAMKKHAKNLGLRGKLYAAFACMVTGRTWSSITQGLDKKLFTETEKEFIQTKSSEVLSKIINVLDQVNREMLLIFRTNDLIRGIEFTLNTYNRNTAFWVMSKCCVRTIYSVELKELKKFKRFKKLVRKNWEIFKLNIYYLYRGIVNFGFINSIRQMKL